MAINVEDLKDQTGMPEPRPVLHCTVCDQTFSANKGDYFYVGSGEPFMHCDEPMELAAQRTIFATVKK